MSDAPLPAGWIAKESTSHPGKVYFFNTVSGVRALTMLSLRARARLGSATAAAASRRACLCRTPCMASTVYVCPQESQWERPTEPSGELAA